MDAKTYEYMNDRVKRFNEAQRKINDLKVRIENLVRYGLESIYFTIPNGSYTSVPHIDKILLKETLLKLMNDKITVLEKELEEI